MSVFRRLSVFAALLTALPAAAQTPAPAPGQPPAPAAGPQVDVLNSLEQKLAALQHENGLTSNETARRARANSAELESKRHAITVAEETVSQTKYGFWPRLTLAAAYTRLSAIDPPSFGDFGGGGSMVVTPSPPGALGDADPLFAVTPPEISFEPVLDNYQFSAELAIPLSDYVLRLSSAVAAASRVRDAAALQEKAVARSVDRDARVAYYEWIRAQAGEIIATQSLEQAQGHLKDAQNAFQAGMISKADVLQAEVRVKASELFLERTQNAIQLRHVGLAVAMGDRSGARYQAGENAFSEIPELSRLPNAQASTREALSQRLELKALIESERAFREQATVERAARYPRLDARASALYANPNPRFFPQEERFDGTWDAGVVLSWTPTDIGGANAAGSIAEARALELAAQRRGIADGIRIEVEQALTAAADARFSIEVSRHALSSAEEGYRVRRELFRAGRATFVELTDATTDLTRARLELADALVSGHIALTQLRHALGRDQTVARR